MLLTYLRSYQQMGVAQVKCVAGCTCPTSELDGTWDTKASLLQIHRFKVGGWVGGGCSVPGWMGLLFLQLPLPVADAPATLPAR